jgi:hypothetical protein
MIHVRDARGLVHIANEDPIDTDGWYLQTACSNFMHRTALVRVETSTSYVTCVTCVLNGVAALRR